MSASIQTVSFQREAVLSSLSEGPPWTVSGIALGAGDVTLGQSGIKKVWPAEELEKAATTLQGTNLVVDHDNESSGVVGQVTKAGFKSGVGVIYEAELFDEDLAQKINNGLLEVSIRGFHADVEQMDENEEGAKVVEGIKFDNLSIVPTGAAPSNTIDMGEHDELSAAELAAFISELQEIEPSSFVKWDDNRGVVLSVEEGEAEVDIYEESDGKWRSTGETTTVSVDNLDMWDVDEEDIGSMEEAEELQGLEIHSPDYSGTTTGSWSAPSLEDFGEAPDLSDVDDHFLVSKTGFPPENFGDLALPVVNSEGNLNLSALRNAKGRAGQVSGLSGENLSRVKSKINNLANKEFDADFEEASGHKMDPDVDDDKEEETGKHHHKATAKMLSDFLSIEGNSTDNSVSSFLDWASDDSAQRAVDEFVRTEGNSLESSISEFKNFLDAAVSSEDDEEQASKVEGSEEPITSDADKKKNREQSPERFVDDADEELQGAVHKPEFSGRDNDAWEKPTLSDFTDESWDDLSDEEKSSIGDHFIFSASGFPADSFGDMKLPIVRPDGTLSMNAVNNADARLSQTEGLSSDQRERVQSMLDDLQGDEEENSGHGAHKRPRTIDDTGDEPGVQNDGPVDISLDLINKYLRIEGNHERDKVDGMLSWLFSTTDLPTETLADFRSASRRFLDETPGTDSFSGLTVEQFRDWLLMRGDRSAGQREMDDETQRGELPPGKATPVHVLTGNDFWQRDKSRESELDNATYKVINMTEDIEEKLAELNEPVAVEQGDLDELQEKADRFEEMSSTLESLKERTDILDSVDREQVEELAESDEPVVVESARYEELEAETEEVKMVYAAALAEEMPAFDAEELAESFGIEALREKYEEHVGELEEELSPEPKSGDVEEEELEERAEEESEEELEGSETDEAEAKREELREKIRSGL